MNFQLPAPLRKWTDSAWSLFYPEVCQLCGRHRATRRQGYVCDTCAAEARFIRPPLCDRCGMPFPGDITVEFECSNCRDMDLHFCWARSAVVAKDKVLEAIHRYKYDRQLWFEEFLAELFLRGVGDFFLDEHWDALVPVPLFPVKQREREFNQAERLARRLGEAANVPVEGKLLKRVVPTRSQTRLSREQRAENMRGAFALRTPTRLLGKRYVVIDDVFTTGATTSACAKVLRDAGAEAVAVWTLARGVGK